MNSNASEFIDSAVQAKARRQVTLRLAGPTGAAVKEHAIFTVPFIDVLAGAHGSAVATDPVNNPHQTSVSTRFLEATRDLSRRDLQLPSGWGWTVCLGWYTHPRGVRTGYLFTTSRGYPGPTLLPWRSSWHRNHPWLSLAPGRRSARGHGHGQAQLLEGQLQPPKGQKPQDQWRPPPQDSRQLQRLCRELRDSRLRQL